MTRGEANALTLPLPAVLNGLSRRAASKAPPQLPSPKAFSLRSSVGTHFVGSGCCLGKLLVLVLATPAEPDPAVDLVRVASAREESASVVFALVVIVRADLVWVSVAVAAQLRIAQVARVLLGSRRQEGDLPISAATYC